jgi:fatty acid desaturase
VEKPAAKAAGAPALRWHLHGAEYDFEPFVRHHPGGELAIRLAQGIDDATSLFASYHPVGRGRAWETLERFRVGGALPSAPVPSAFRDDIERMVASHFGASGTPALRERTVATLAHKALVGAFAAVQLAGWVAWLRGETIGLLLVPLFHYFTMVNISHDATHFATSRSPGLNAVLAFASLPYSYGPVTWYSQHVVMHHTATNEVLRDPDVHHFNPLLVHSDVRLEGERPNVHTLLDYLKVFLVGIQLCFAVPLSNSGYAPKGFEAEWKSNFPVLIPTPPGLRASRLYQVLNGLPIVALWACLLRPWFAMGLCGKAAAFSLVPPMVASLLFVVVTQVSHIQPEAQRPEHAQEPDFLKRQVCARARPARLSRRGRRGARKQEAAFSTRQTRARGEPGTRARGSELLRAAEAHAHSPHASPPSPSPSRAASPPRARARACEQVLTAVDYSCESEVWRVLTGGLNVQSLHHVLPHISSCHYTALYPAFERVCQAHGLTIQKRDGLLHAMRTAFAHVWAINRTGARRAAATCARPCPAQLRPALPERSSPRSLAPRLAHRHLARACLLASPHPSPARSLRLVVQGASASSCGAKCARACTAESSAAARHRAAHAASFLSRLYANGFSPAPRTLSRALHDEPRASQWLDRSQRSGPRGALRRFACT